MCEVRGKVKAKREFWRAGWRGARSRRGDVAFMGGDLKVGVGEKEAWRFAAGRRGRGAVAGGGGWVVEVVGKGALEG